MKHPINRAFRDVVNILLRRTFGLESRGSARLQVRFVFHLFAADAISPLFLYGRYTKTRRPLSALQCAAGAPHITLHRMI
jgi:hypothetical protein